MTVTIRCPRCAVDVHLVMDDPGIVQVVPHACYRFLVAEFWENGEITGVWTSEEPGRSGPKDLVRDHSQQADQGWKPPPGSGWTYRWRRTLRVDEVPS